MRKIKKTAGYYARKLRVKMIKSASDGLSVKAYGRSVWSKSQSYISKNGYNHYASIKDDGSALARAVETDRRKQWQIHGDYQKNMQKMFRNIKVDNSAQLGRGLVYLYTPSNARLNAGYKDLVSRWNFSKTNASEMVEDDVKVSILNVNKTHNFLAGSGDGFVAAVTSNAGKGDIEITDKARSYMLICKNLLEEWDSLIDKWAEGEDAWRIYRKKNPGSNPVGKDPNAAQQGVTTSKDFKDVTNDINQSARDQSISIWFHGGNGKYYAYSPKAGSQYYALPKEYGKEQLAELMWAVVNGKIRFYDTDSGKEWEKTNAGWQEVK